MSDFQLILFVGKPVETSPFPLEDLMAELREEGVLSCLHTDSLGPNDEQANAVIDQSLPDLICLFADDLTARGEDPLGYCSRLREHVTRYRPVLVVQTGAPESARIQYLIQGSDDILGADLSAEEFKVRLLVHLRRNLDMNAHDLTKLPSLHFASRVIQRRLNQGQPFALLAVELDHLDAYTEVYGQLPTAQVLKTFAAMLSRLVIFPDFISQTEENTFVVVTHPDKAEKLAGMLCRQFETVVPNFYSEKDRKQGYIMSVLPGNISQRVPLLTLSIGIASSQNHPFDSFLSAFNAAMQMKALARMNPGNTWLSDKPRLVGDSQPAVPRTPSILVLESDAALAFLLKTTLEIEGYRVDVASGLEDARESMRERKPDMVILDALINGQENGLALCEEVRDRWPHLAIICTSSLHDRQRVLTAGADLYLPKPYELLSLFSWVHRLLERAA